MDWEPNPPPFAKYKKQVFTKAAQTSQFIYQIGEYSALRKKSNPVPIKKIRSLEYKQKFAYIKTCLAEYRRITGYGRGITAVQIGIPECFSVIYMPEKFLIVINPQILHKSKKILIYPEICMSANPIISPTARPAWIEFEYYDENGDKQKWKIKDDSDMNRVLNRVFQHEFDHMEGIINIDRVKSQLLTLESDPSFYTTARFQKAT